MESQAPQDSKVDPNSYKKVFWVASYPKSGNTWVRALLSAYYDNGNVDINNLSACRTDDTSSLPYPDHVNDFLQIVTYRPWMLMEVVKANPDVECILIKTHFANMQFMSMPLLPPAVTKGALYIVRDPRDMVLSYARHYGQDLDTSISRINSEFNSISSPWEDTAKHWTVLGDWSSHVMSWVQKPYTMVLRYEDIHRNTEVALTEILKAIGEPDIDKKLVRASVKACKFNMLRRQENKNKFRESSPHAGPFFHTGKVGMWKYGLSPEQQNEIIIKHHKTMQKFGYLQ